MPQARASIFWKSLIAATFVATAPLVHADDPSASADKNSDYKTVPVTVNGQKIPVRVAETNPYAHVQSTTLNDGKYHPENYSFNTTSSMGNKSFALPTSSLSHGDPEFTDPSRNAYVTKSYVDGASPSSANPDTKSRFPTFAANNSRPVSGFDKSYATASADPALNHPAEFPPSNTAADQNRAALLPGQDKDLDLTANSMANKQYLGPGAQHIPDDVDIKDNIVLTRMSGLPNRPLSIDEVRNLINHETKPDTTVKPEQPSKPLNDPEYKPEPLRDDPSPDGASAPHPGKYDLVPAAANPNDDDKNDPVPAPGTMAAPPAPENSEPLPQQ